MGRKKDSPFTKTAEKTKADGEALYIEERKESQSEFVGNYSDRGKAARIANLQKWAAAAENVASPST